MTDPNTPAAKSHAAALEHLGRMAARRAAAQAHTAAWEPNAPQKSGGEPAAPRTEAEP